MSEQEYSPSAEQAAIEVNRYGFEIALISKLEDLHRTIEFFGRIPEEDTGLTLVDHGFDIRDHFAGEAMKAIMAQSAFSPDGMELAAALSYSMADAMLKARKA
jgi:hypothetical protein